MKPPDESEVLGAVTLPLDSAHWEMVQWDPVQGVPVIENRHDVSVLVYRAGCARALYADVVLDPYRLRVRILNRKVPGNGGLANQFSVAVGDTVDLPPNTLRVRLVTDGAQSNPA